MALQYYGFPADKTVMASRYLPTTAYDLYRGSDGRLYGPDQGIFYAADGLCRQPDIWGMAYMLAIGFPLEASVRAAVERWLTEHQPEYLYRGRCATCPAAAPGKSCSSTWRPGNIKTGPTGPRPAAGCGRFCNEPIQKEQAACSRSF